jgi:hypothetical protein
MLVPTFTTAAGLPLTPSSSPSLDFTIPSLAPFLESITITNTAASQTAATFTVVVVGYSTTRSLNTLNVTFTAASGFNLTAPQASIDLTGPSGVWFQSSASQAFGGLFQVSEQFNLTGTAPKGDTVLQAIGSVSATISNGVGTSGPISFSLQ